MARLRVGADGLLGIGAPHRMGQADRITAPLASALGRLVIWLLACLALPVIAGAAPATAEETTPTAVAIRISAEPARTRFVVDITRTVGFNVYVLPDPYRVIVDLPQVVFRLPPASGSKGGGLLTGYRYGSLDKGRSRIVMDASRPVLIEKSFILHPRDGEPARLVVDLVATERETFNRLQRVEQLPADVAAKAVEDVPRELPPISFGPPTTETREADAEPAAKPDRPPARLASREPGKAVPLPRPKPESSKAAAQPGVAPPAAARDRLTVVIDPGHGGIDPGAISRSGTAEKDVVLAFSKALQQVLVESGRYRVIMTRTDDVFLSLRDRVRVARSNGADLFVVIHADSLSRGAARGATVYTVSDKASDAEAEALAQKENRADIIAGVDLAAESEEITGILIDLAQRETRNHSVLFAKQLVKQLQPVARLNSRPMRSAGFRVLKAPDVPSVLLELGYLSNRNDESLLSSPEWRGKVARAVADAVDRYFITQLAAGQ